MYGHMLDVEKKKEEEEAKGLCRAFCQANIKDHVNTRGKFIIYCVLPYFQSTTEITPNANQTQEPNLSSLFLSSFSPPPPFFFLLFFIYHNIRFCAAVTSSSLKFHISDRTGDCSKPAGHDTGPAVADPDVVGTGN